MPVTIIRRDGRPIGIVDGATEFPALAWFHENWDPAYSMAHALAHEGYSTETVDEIDCHGAEADIIDGIAARLGLSAKFQFVPFSHSRHAKPAPGTDKPWPSLNWDVTLYRSTRPILATPYATGTAWAPADKWPAADPEARRRKAEAIRIETETGRHARRHDFGGAVTVTRKPIDPPPLADVLQSLAKECDVLDYAGFEDWASSYGYDTDSRRADAIHRACIEIATKLRAGIGASALAELQLAASFA